MNVLAALLFLLVGLQPALHPESFWFVSFLSLAFPYLALLLLLFAVGWLFFHPVFSLISITALGLNFRQLKVLAGMHKEPMVKSAPAKGNLRIMTWNVKAFQGLGMMNKREKIANAENIIRLVGEYLPDVVCMQEFGQYDDPGVGRNHIQKMRELGYEYFVLSKDYSRVTFGYSSGLAVFSRHPILAQKRIPFTSSAESLLIADVLWGSDTIRIFNAHLQSFKFSEKDYNDLQKIKNTDDEMVRASADIFTKMERAFRNRGSQADQIRPILDSSEYPAVFCTDMNDVPQSYAYWRLRGSRKDAFLEKGFGIGRTYMSLAPTLRIDYIFCDQTWEVVQVGTVANRFSDHRPVVADMVLRR